MPRLPIHPASGTGIVTPFAKVIRLARYGCTNRPFYHIVVIGAKKKQRDPPIEQLGTYDPLPNMYNEKLIALNLERIHYWLGKGARLSDPVSQLLGLAGFLPIFPETYYKAWKNRKAADEAASKADEEKEAVVKAT